MAKGSDLRCQPSRGRCGINGIREMLGQDESALVADVVAFVAHDVHLARVNVGHGHVGHGVAKDDGGADIGHVATQRIRRVMDREAALRVAADDNLGVRAGSASITYNLGPFVLF